MDPIIIVGSGLAGYTLAREFRKLDATTPLTIITADDGGFYSKPMLSGAIGAGKTADQLVTLDANAMATQLLATVITHARVDAITPAMREIHLDDGRWFRYSTLALATGAQPIRLPLAGTGADAVLSINHIDDYRRFRARLQPASRIAIIGAGLIGCEFAHDLSIGGHHVSVIGKGEAPLDRLTPAEFGHIVASRLAELGVDWHLGTEVSTVDRADEAYTVTLTSGKHIEADLVLSAVGLAPDTWLARAAGLATARGIRVDRFLRSSDRHIHALGDCAEVEGLVLPFVMPLMAQARALARTLAGDESAVSYPAMPVTVKTPRYPVVVCPPLPGSPGEWRIECDGNDVRALFEHEGQLRGFALGGARAGEKSALLPRIAPWLE